MVNPVDFDSLFVKMPASSTVRLTVTEFFADERCEFDILITNGFVTDIDATFEEEFLNVAVTQGEAVVSPEGVLDDKNWKAMTVRFVVWHGRRAYQ